ncbi:hypothetical protein [Micromonospora sp. NBC_00860]|uniref:hypothetical protein n=1 Tax=Micromonospora sp. NBC_00860 TaxID=2975980 RepID=UPI00386DDC08|nr:hypothetical protein OH804_32670 [Micromonospora sp. NBC_00860]
MRLMMFTVGPILLMWLFMSRVPRIRWLVALCLAGLTVLAGTLIHFLPRGLWEISLTCLAVAVLVVVAARLYEHRRLGPGNQAGMVVSTRLLAGWLLVVLCCGAVLGRPGPFFPATDQVLPLPNGLQATVLPYDDGNCGSGSCQRTITVTGRTGQSGEDLYAEVKRHVKARGWGRGCRPVGWLLDRSTECIELAADAGQVTISLSGNRDDLRHLTTID